MKSVKNGYASLAIAATLIFTQAMGLSAPRAAEISDFSPEGIQKFLTDNGINTADKFAASLPTEYKEFWIMISRSQSSQSGTANFPRFILSSKDSTKVFGFELPSNSAAVAPNTIEYIQFDAMTKKFRFHSIVTDAQRVNKDEEGCQTCHYGNPRPNWDAYDSWPGMLPFNRDRVYKYLPLPGHGIEETVEAKAIKRIFKALKLNSDKLFGQLTLPNGILQDATTGDVTIKFGPPCDPPCFTDGGTDKVIVKYGSWSCENVKTEPQGIRWLWSSACGDFRREQTLLGM